jgi:hypothetical protein
MLVLIEKGRHANDHFIPKKLKTHIKSYRSTPRAHQSSVKSCPVPDIISGAV